MKSDYTIIYEFEKLTLAEILSKVPSNIDYNDVKFYFDFDYDDDGNKLSAFVVLTWLTNATK